MSPILCHFEKLTSPRRRYVAVKVGLGSDTPHVSRETETLSQLCKTGAVKYGCQRVLKLFDTLIIEGPNGFHECLVTEVVSPLNDPGVRQYCSFEAVRQIVEGFAFLHEEGIVHGGKLSSLFYSKDGQAADLDRSTHRQLWDCPPPAAAIQGRRYYGILC